MNVNYLPECAHLPDLIFMDPPFGHQVIQLTLNRLFKKNWISNDTIVVLRSNNWFEDNRFEVLNMEKIGISRTYILKLALDAKN